MRDGRIYYNEIDRHAAAWLRQLIADGHLPAGDVDERSIEDVVPGDLRGYRQCHFFAGIGGWPYALRLAGWPDDRPVWTGSCPCQPFSAAGAGAGFADERHLWPAWQHLIAQCQPPVIFGEQVASKAVGPWLDLVQADLEGMGYAFGSIAFPAASLGAPHIRDRTYWVADAIGDGPQGRLRGWAYSERETLDGSAGRVRADCGVAYAKHPERRPINIHRQDGRHGQDAGRQEAHGITGTCCEVRWLADADGWDTSTERQQRGGEQRFQPQNGSAGGLAHADRHGCEPRSPATSSAGHRDSLGPARGDAGHGHASTHHGGWSAADWLFCRDGKWRPVEPGTFPLVDGLPAGVVRIGDPGAPIDAARSAEGRVMRLRGYGNAIMPEQAAMFVLAFLDVRPAA